MVSGQSFSRWRRRLLMAPLPRCRNELFCFCLPVGGKGKGAMKDFRNSFFFLLFHLLGTQARKEGGGASGGRAEGRWGEEGLDEGTVVKKGSVDFTSSGLWRSSRFFLALPCLHQPSFGHRHKRKMGGGEKRNASYVNSCRDCPPHPSKNRLQDSVGFLTVVSTRPVSSVSPPLPFPAFCAL